MTINDNFSYRDPNGKRKPRTWVLAVAVIVIIVLAVVGLSVYNASARQAQIEATPRLVTGPTFTPTAVLPTKVPTSVGAMVTVNCPSDSADWNFVDVLDNSNFKRIDPPCVYQGMNRTIAYYLASEGAGWKKADALQKLGYTGDFPYDNSLDTIDVLPTDASSNMFTVKTSWLPWHKDFQLWYVANNTVVSHTITVTGCYRTFNIVGNQKQYWSQQWAPSSYTTICQIAEEFPAGSNVYQVDDAVYFRTNAQPGVELGYLAYDNRSQYQSWYFVGWDDSSWHIISAADMVGIKNSSQQLINSPVWDLSWLEQNYGISPLPLPANWQQHATKADSDALMTALNK